MAETLTRLVAVTPQALPVEEGFDVEQPVYLVHLALQIVQTLLEALDTLEVADLRKVVLSREEALAAAPGLVASATKLLLQLAEPGAGSAGPEARFAAKKLQFAQDALLFAGRVFEAATIWALQGGPPAIPAESAYEGSSYSPRYAVQRVVAEPLAAGGERGSRRAPGHLGVHAACRRWQGIVLAVWAAAETVAQRKLGDPQAEGRYGACVVFELLNGLLWCPGVRDLLLASEAGWRSVLGVYESMLVRGQRRNLLLLGCSGHASIACGCDSWYLLCARRKRSAALHSA